MKRRSIDVFLLLYRVGSYTKCRCSSTQGRRVIVARKRIAATGQMARDLQLVNRAGEQLQRAVFDGAVWTLRLIIEPGANQFRLRVITKRRSPFSRIGTHAG
jgi:hypothetical protein